MKETLGSAMARHQLPIPLLRTSMRHYFMLFQLLVSFQFSMRTFAFPLRTTTIPGTTFQSNLRSISISSSSSSFKVQRIHPRRIYSLNKLHLLQVQPKYSSTAKQMRMQMENQQSELKVEKIRVLALHGKGGSGQQFNSYLQPFLTTLQSHYTKSVSIEFDFLDAPFEAGQWWTLPQGVRSFNAKEYQGFEQSASLVENAILNPSSSTSSSSPSSSPSYDFILGHSQGAILLSALLIQKKTIQEQCYRQNIGLILNGAAWPNPYTEQLESFRIEGEVSCLFVIGNADKINPPEGAKRIRECFKNGGLEVFTVNHPGGHSVPVQDNDALQGIISWMDAFAMRKKLE